MEFKRLGVWALGLFVGVHGYVQSKYTCSYSPKTLNPITVLANLWDFQELANKVGVRELRARVFRLGSDSEQRWCESPKTVSSREKR